MSNAGTKGKPSTIRKLLNYFIQGLILTVPIAVTIYVIIKAIFWIDGLIPFNIPIHVPGSETVYDLPGLGILLILIIVTFLGFIATRFVANPMFLFVERIMEKTPLLKIIYTSVKDLIEAFVGDKKRFTKPVLVTVSETPEVQRLGFITQNDLNMIGIKTGKVAVYLPFSYSFAGELLILDSSKVEPIEASGTETMKFIISGGVTDID
ncbi:MAG TPA: DUF502 domain-containing protein [Bacteroidia bacterium]|nr:DUF502 domain-containing protein [Bacteroidia bacterium]HNT79875.1 DUF502 domain-containing protein [Bacteroidia bacterium]